MCAILFFYVWTFSLLIQYCKNYFCSILNWKKKYAKKKKKKIFKKKKKKKKKKTFLQKKKSIHIKFCVALLWYNFYMCDLWLSGQNTCASNAHFNWTICLDVTWYIMWFAQTNSKMADTNTVERRLVWYRKLPLSAAWSVERHMELESTGWIIINLCFWFCTQNCSRSMSSCSDVNTKLWTAIVRIMS